MKDGFGREIQVGDRVLYPTRYGSTQTMNVGIVREVYTKKYSWNDREEPRLKVICINDTGHPLSGFQGRREVVLKALRNVVVIDNPGEQFQVREEAP